jgi:hypothetical protein
LELVSYWGAEAEEVRVSKAAAFAALSWICKLWGVLSSYLFVEDTSKKPSEHLQLGVMRSNIYSAVYPNATLEVRFPLPVRAH